jgi:hypothetical protein
MCVRSFLFVFSPPIHYHLTVCVKGHSRHVTFHLHPAPSLSTLSITKDFVDLLLIGHLKYDL